MRCPFLALVPQRPFPSCFSQLLLQKRGNLKLNSITTMYYVSPCCFVFLLVPWTFLELPKLVRRLWTAISNVSSTARPNQHVRRAVVQRGSMHMG